jgi:integrase
MHEVKRLMGHSSIRTTERFYLAASTDLARQVNDAFARIDDAEQSGVTESTG